MSLDLSIIELVKAIISLLIVVDPLGNMPIFISVTASLPKDRRIETFNIAVLTGFSLLTVFALLSISIGIQCFSLSSTIEVIV